MYIRVRVIPDAKKEYIEKISETEYVMSVTEPAKQNQANKKIFSLLQTVYPHAVRIQLVGGAHASLKLFFITTAGTAQ